jgi:hypothetical protein
LGEDITSWPKTGKHDHSDLGHAVLQALVQARILVPIDSEGDELEDTNFPLAGQLQPRPARNRPVASVVGRLAELDISDDVLTYPASPKRAAELVEPTAHRIHRQQRGPFKLASRPDFIAGFRA